VFLFGLSNAFATWRIPWERRVASSPREAFAIAYRQPVAAFGVILIAIIWSGAALLLFADYRAHVAKAANESLNLARIAQQNAMGMIEGVDKRLKFLRWVEQEKGGAADWPALLADRNLVEEGVQISVIDAAGLVIASSLEKHFDKLIDVSDRPPFLAQRDSQADDLYIGPVVIGRLSGVRTMQFSRKRFDAQGRFAGVFVFSLATDYFNQEFASLDLPVGGGLALVGDDGQIRSGSGIYLNWVGRPYTAQGDADSAYAATPAAIHGFDASRRVGGYPVSTVAHLPTIEADAGWRIRLKLVLVVALVATLSAFFATLRVARRRRSVERELFFLSRHDVLTGLANRRSLSDTLDQLCYDKDDEFALHVLDLDRFKSVNDTYGHLVGDEVLRQAADRLAKLVGEDDLVARLGGDEFAILQRVTSFETEAPALARKVNRAMAQPFPTSRVNVSIGATVGVARGRADGASAVELMQAADLALYAAKSDGRGCARVFRRELTEAAVARVKLEAGLRRALDQHEFHLVYQPIYSLQRNAIVGYEALLRWRPDGGDLVPSSEFIPVAEDIGLIVNIGAWALRRACADIAALPGEFEVSVNVSGVQLDAGAFAGDVSQALRATGLAARRLRIEITESTLLQDKPVVADQIRALRDLGVGVSLDDFGTGYSCLSYLEMYPIDTLKIDRLFVAKLGARPEAVDTLRAIVDLARSFGMKTVAEGVETQSQLEALKALGCERAQGYLLGHPAALPAASSVRAA
jgi:diguanylate cyclase (GGDEF)-like protein